MKLRLLLSLAAGLSLTGLAQASDFPLSGAQFAKATKSMMQGDPASQPAMKMEAQTPAATLFDGSGCFVQFQTGLDFSYLDEIINGTNAWKNFFGGADISGTAARGGVASDLSYGFHLDPSSSLAIDLGNVLTVPSYITATAPGGPTMGAVKTTPSLWSTSLVYSLDLVQNSGSRIYFSLGGGWYHGVVDMWGVGAPMVGGTFTGDTVGGTLGMGGEMDLGSSFGLGFAVKGRYAYFSRVSSDKAVGITPGAGTASLTFIPGGSNHFLFPMDNADIESSGYGYAAVDYSGIDAQFSLTYRFF